MIWFICHVALQSISTNIFIFQSAIICGILSSGATFRNYLLWEHPFEFKLRSFLHWLDGMSSHHLVGHRRTFTQKNSTFSKLWPFQTNDIDMRLEMCRNRILSSHCLSSNSDVHFCAWLGRLSAAFCQDSRLRNRRDGCWRRQFHLLHGNNRTHDESEAKRMGENKVSAKRYTLIRCEKRWNVYHFLHIYQISHPSITSIFGYDQIRARTHWIWYSIFGICIL